VQRTAETNQEKWYFDSSHVTGRSPSGPHIEAALNVPLEVLKYAEGYGCEYDKADDVLSKLTKLRSAMAKVNLSKGQALRNSLNVIEMKCRSARR
jgi:hypothetical protein